jgi:predicted DNA-binding protein with PD1-like motif
MTRAAADTLQQLNLPSPTTPTGIARASPRTMRPSTRTQCPKARSRSRAPQSFVTLALFAATFCAACDRRSPEFRYLSAPETKPRGAALNAQARLLAATPDGTKTHVLVLAEGDEVMTALSDFMRREKVASAAFHGIGAVRDAELAWFDPERQKYKALTTRDQVEVLALNGDAALDSQQSPTVHAHVVLGTENTRTLGGHLIHAVTSPNLELFITSYPTALKKRPVPGKGFERIDPTLSQE